MPLNLFMRFFCGIGNRIKRDENILHAILLVSMLLIILSFFSTPAFAGHELDNPLQPLDNYNPKKSKLAAEFEIFPLPGLGFFEFADETGKRSYTLNFNLTLPENTEKSYLYIFTKYYDHDDETWYVKINDNAVVLGEHSESAGANPKGDGKDPLTEEEVSVPQLKQAIRIDVTGKLKNGENELKIDGLSWEMITSKRSSAYSLYGIGILNLYKTNKEHELWIYEGVEYFERRTVLEDENYTINFNGASYSLPANAKLYVFYHNPENGKDSLYFNDHLLEDDKAEKTTESSFLNLKKFNVSSYADKSDKVSFTAPIREAIYPSIVILDVEVEDKTAPEITVISPENGSEFLKNESISIKYRVNEELSENKVDVLNLTLIPEQSANEFTARLNLSSLGVENQSVDIKILAKDLSNNSAESTIKIKILPLPEIEKENMTANMTSNATTNMTGNITSANITGNMTGNLTTNESIAPSPTLPPIEKPELKDVDLAITTIAIDEGFEVKEGESMHVNVFTENRGSEDTLAEVALYLDDSIIETKTIELEAYGHLRVTFDVEGYNLKKGIREIKARIRHVKEGLTDSNQENNEKTISITVEPEEGIFSRIINIAKWLIGIAVAVIILKLVIDFIRERMEEDYLR